ncbi:cache domain-containing protein [Arcobacter sp. FWKO B]|uniref:cache domain-containing protein n=1 Tax=Arcobacter sp. FWKO B TaxID=2593672 RepID=UPI00190726AB|nr:ATP-binding protein [Arcobacter sp. FWKO B]
MSIKRKFIFFYIVTLLCVGIILYIEKESKINNYLIERTNIAKINYNSLYNEYKKIADIIFLTQINQKEILEIFSQANKVSKVEQQNIRNTLYRNLDNVYALLNSYNLRQLHFHLPNSDSFLRFHRPEKFGDSLVGIRDTIEFVNKYKKPIDGFEEGRIFNGYRFVYPLFFEDIHIGSVEVSFSTSEFAKEYDMDYGSTSFFLVSKKLVDQKVFEDEQDNYSVSFLDDFYILNEKDTINQVSKMKEISKGIKNTKTIENKIYDGVGFSISSPDNLDTITFIPILNSITQSVSAVHIIKHKSIYIKNKIVLTNILLVVLFTLISLIFYFLYLNFRHKKELQDKIDLAVAHMRHQDMILHRQSKAAALGEMIDAIGHQWKTPLSIIRLYAQDIGYILKTDNNIDKKELLFYLNKILFQTEHLNETIDSFREFFRPLSNIEDVILKELIDNTLVIVKDEMIQYNIIPSITGDFDTKVCLVPNEFKHVILNLIKNSKDAFIENNTKDRVINFHIKQLNVNEIELQISDNAGGIPKNVIEHIFEPNFSIKSQDIGTGIGLYISKQILDKIGAEINVENIDNGTKFIIIIYKACELRNIANHKKNLK